MPIKGNYDLCFIKSSLDTLEVHFDVLEVDQLDHDLPAGKKELNKVVYRVGDFLIEIKKTSGEYKEVLSQHNARVSKLKDYGANNM